LQNLDHCSSCSLFSGMRSPCENNLYLASKMTSLLFFIKCVNIQLFQLALIVIALCDPWFSEPPDIRNWFSSYKYESSTFDISSILSNDEVSEGNKCGDERFDFEVVNKDEGQSENVQPKVCVDHNSSFDKNMEVKQKNSDLSC
jgi:hypothetical protein